MAAAYVTVADLLKRSDRRAIRELASDNDAPIEDASLSTDPNVLQAIEDAEGETLSALFSGGRYSESQIAALTGSSLAYFKRIVCEIALLHMYRRRPSWDPNLLEAYEKIRTGHLDRLSKGDAIFGGNDSRIDAGLASIDGPTLSEIADLNFFSDRSGYFRPRTLPNGRNI